jgi:hypothetical protein
MAGTPRSLTSGASVTRPLETVYRAQIQRKLRFPARADWFGVKIRHQISGLDAKLATRRINGVFLTDQRI